MSTRKHQSAGTLIKMDLQVTLGRWEFIDQINMSGHNDVKVIQLYHLCSTRMWVVGGCGVIAPHVLTDTRTVKL